jgi:hypothetical protein
MELDDIQLARLKRRVRDSGAEVPPGATAEYLLVVAVLTDPEIEEE